MTSVPNPNRQRVIDLWNTTTWSASRIAGVIGCGLTRAAVCGIIHRTPSDQIFRRTRPLPGRSQRKKGRKGNINTFTNKLPADPALSLERLEKLVPPVNEAGHRASMPEAIVALRPRQCRWPVHDFERFTFCEEAALPDRCYCAEHWQRSLKRNQRNDTED